MPFSTAIKWLHRLVTVSLLVVVAGFWWLNHQPTPGEGEELQRAYKLNENVWLYTTVNRNGGATVPVVYRYYLAKEIQGNDNSILKALTTTSPVIVGTGSITDAHSDKNGQVHLSYSGKVFSMREDVSQLELTVGP